MPFYLEGEGGLYEFVERRLQENGHMVIVVAEGAGQELMEASSTLRDASGNQLLHDIGLWLSQKLKVCLQSLSKFHGDFKECKGKFMLESQALDSDS